MSVFLLTLAVQSDGIRRFTYPLQLHGSAESAHGHFQAFAARPRISFLQLHIVRVMAFSVSGNAELNW
jgi:hypothetical protein